MKSLIILFLILGLNAFCYADRVCLVKDTGKLIEYQSGSVNDDLDNFPIEKREQVKADRLNSLKQNAINAGYKEKDIVVKEVTMEEWAVIKEKWITKPTREAKTLKDAEKAIKKEAIKTKLGLTDEDIEALKEVLK